VITIFDYGAGNLRSVENTLGELGCDYRLVRDAAGLEAAAKIVLPGVGHFGQMMRALDQLGVRATLMDRIAAGVPFLGICLGLQALYESSEEAPDVRGLGVFPGVVRRFPADARVPHMGWNQLEPRRESKLLRSRIAPRRRRLHLRTPVHRRPRVGQRVRRAIPSRKIRRHGPPDCEKLCGHVKP